jgi:hypothetical protein
MAQRLASHSKAGSSKAGAKPNPKALPAQQDSISALKKKLAAKKAAAAQRQGGDEQQAGDQEPPPGVNIEADRFLTAEDFQRIKKLKHRWAGLGGLEGGWRGLEGAGARRG